MGQVIASLPEQVEEGVQDERLQKAVGAVGAKGAREAEARMVKGRDCPRR